MTPRSWLLIALIVIAVVLMLRWIYRSKPIPESPPMRTASKKQIERETAEIQGDDDGSIWTRIAAAIGLVMACMLVAAVVVPK